ncbi:hypothetical protein H2204_002408 [Knufia peltigerae]|uniref:Uncharacterized protein n=1 Tax=Knufia peltigerae TaxID=1002370 RepID=A0AA39D2Q1_9EURO|nr:hypothetical protein H2204_002408 [Knufia peltigerae]
MAKSKGQSLYLPDDSVLSAAIQESIQTPASETTTKAADGHNVDGWTEEDIRTYNELLEERAKLEKEKNELERKSSRHQAQRALLDENALVLDTLFVGHPGGIQKFIGSYSCCLDENPETARHEASGNACPSGHEICRRAKTKGISWMELDTIKSYQSRIRSERSERMQKALRKQRDVELIRVKKEDDEQTLKERKTILPDKRSGHTKKSPAKRTDAVRSPSSDGFVPEGILSDPKKNAILEAARKNEFIVRQIRGRLDQIRHDVNAGKISLADACTKLDQANAEMADAEKKNNDFRKLILPISDCHASSSTILQNAIHFASPEGFCQISNVFQAFFSASDPKGVHAAMTEFRGVLEMYGPKTPEFQEYFGALEEVLSNPDAKGFAVNDKADYEKIDPLKNVDLMLQLRSKMQTSDFSSLAIDPTLNINQEAIRTSLECVKVEDAAKKEMVKAVRRMDSDSPAQVAAALKKIKSKALLKSPCAEVSEIILGDIINTLLFDHIVCGFLSETGTITSVNELSGRLTKLVISTAHNKPEKYLSIFDGLKASFMSVLKDQPSQELTQAISKVEVSMVKFVAAHDEKRKNNMGENVSMPALHAITKLNASSLMFDVGFLLSGTHMSKDSWESFEAFFNEHKLKDRDEVRNHVLDYVYNHVEEGIWDVFRVVTARLISQTMRPGPWNEAKELYLRNMRVAASTPTECLEDAVIRYKHIGTCPAMAAIIIAQRLSYLMRADIGMYGREMLDLGASPTLRAAAELDEWVSTFILLAKAMVNLYNLMYHLIALEDESAATVVSIDVTSLVLTFGLGVEDSAQASFNLGMLESFITRTLIDDNEPATMEKFKEGWTTFQHICQGSQYRCSPSHTCKGRVQGLNVRNVNPIPKPTPRFGKENQMMRLRKINDFHLLTSTSTSNQSFLRGTELSLLVESDWEIARRLLPHLKCMDKQNVAPRCECPKRDHERALEIAKLGPQLNRDFAEVNAFLKSGKAPPDALWERLESNEVKLHDLTVLYSDRRWVAHQDTTNFLKMVQAKANEISGSSSLGRGSSTPPAQGRLNQELVSTPNIQPRAVNGSSESIDTKEISPESASGKQIDGPPQPIFKTSIVRSESPTIASSSTMPPPPPAAPDVAANDHDPVEFVAPETELLLNVTRLVEGMPLLNTTKSALPGVLDPSVFLGVIEKLDEMVLGRLKMAFQVAELQGYHGAHLWLRHNISWSGNLTKYKGCKPCNTSMRVALEKVIKANGWDRVDAPQPEDLDVKVDLPHGPIPAPIPHETKYPLDTSRAQRRRRQKRTR